MFYRRTYIKYVVYAQYLKNLFKKTNASFENLVNALHSSQEIFKVNIFS